MAKPARGLPEGFSLDLPDEGPVVIGNFLDEPPLPAVRKQRPAAEPPKQQCRLEIVREPKDEGGREHARFLEAPLNQASSVIN